MLHLSQLSRTPLSLGFHVLYPLVSDRQVPLSLIDILLERDVLLNQLHLISTWTGPRMRTLCEERGETDLLLHRAELFEIVLQSFKFPLLSSRVCRFSYNLVLLADLIQLHL